MPVGIPNCLYGKAYAFDKFELHSNEREKRNIKSANKREKEAKRERKRKHILKR